MQKVRLSVHVPPAEPTSSRYLPTPARRFLVVIEGDKTIGDLYALIHQKYLASYTSNAVEANNFFIVKLQDEFENDLSREDLISDIFIDVAKQQKVTAVCGTLNRPSSIPADTALRPSGFTPPQISRKRSYNASGSVAKRARIDLDTVDEEDYSRLNPEAPLRSLERDSPELGRPSDHDEAGVNPDSPEPIPTRTDSNGFRIPALPGRRPSARTETGLQGTSGEQVEAPPVVPPPSKQQQEVNGVDQWEIPETQDGFDEPEPEPVLQTVVEPHLTEDNAQATEASAIENMAHSGMPGRQGAHVMESRPTIPSGGATRDKAFQSIKRFRRSRGEAGHEEQPASQVRQGPAPTDPVGVSNREDPIELSDDDGPIVAAQNSRSGASKSTGVSASRKSSTRKAVSEPSIVDESADDVPYPSQAELEEMEIERFVNHVNSPEVRRERDRKEQEFVDYARANGLTPQVLNSMNTTSARSTNSGSSSRPVFLPTSSSLERRSKGVFIGKPQPGLTEMAPTTPTPAPRAGAHASTPATSAQPSRATPVVGSSQASHSTRKAMAKPGTACNECKKKKAKCERGDGPRCRRCRLKDLPCTPTTGGSPAPGTTPESNGQRRSQAPVSRLSTSHKPDDDSPRAIPTPGSQGAPLFVSPAANRTGANGNAAPTANMTRIARPSSSHIRARPGKSLNGASTSTPSKLNAVPEGALEAIKRGKPVPQTAISKGKQRATDPFTLSAKNAQTRREGGQRANRVVTAGFVDGSSNDESGDEDDQASTGSERAPARFSPPKDDPTPSRKATRPGHQSLALDEATPDSSDSGQDAEASEDESDDGSEELSEDESEDGSADESEEDGGDHDEIGNGDEVERQAQHTENPAEDDDATTQAVRKASVRGHLRQPDESPSVDGRSSSHDDPDSPHLEAEESQSLNGKGARFPLRISSLGTAATDSNKSKTSETPVAVRATAAPADNITRNHLTWPTPAPVAAHADVSDSEADDDDEDDDEVVEQHTSDEEDQTLQAELANAKKKAGPEAKPGTPGGQRLQSTFGQLISSMWTNPFSSSQGGGGKGSWHDTPPSPPGQDASGQGPTDGYSETPEEVMGVFVR